MKTIPLNCHKNGFWQHKHMFNKRAANIHSHMWYWFCQLIALKWFFSRIKKEQVTNSKRKEVWRFSTTFTKLSHSVGFYWLHWWIIQRVVKNLMFSEWCGTFEARGEFVVLNWRREKDYEYAGQKVIVNTSGHGQSLTTLLIAGRMKEPMISK